MKVKKWRTSIVLILSLCFWSQSVYAYLDPGTGSMILQLILGGAAGLMVAIKLYWQQLMLWFRPRKKDNNSKEDNETDEAK